MTTYTPQTQAVGPTIYTPKPLPNNQSHDALRQWLQSEHANLQVSITKLNAAITALQSAQSGT